MKALSKKEVKAREKRRELLAKAPFTAEEKTRWERCLIATWHTIGSDYEAVTEEGGGRMTPAIIAEACCDAGYAVMYSEMTSEEYDFLGAIYFRSDFKKWVKGVFSGW